MECIACTACIDACDEVMTKVNKPTGLIRYDSFISAPKMKLTFTPRAGIYLSLCLAALTALTVALASIKPVDVQILRAKDSPYTVQTLEDGTVEIMNHFRVELSNQSGAKHELLFSTPNDFSDHDLHLITAIHPYPLEDGKVVQTDVFIHFPKKLLVNGQKKTRILIQDKNSNNGHVIKIEKEVTLVGPFS